MGFIKGLVLMFVLLVLGAYYSIVVLFRWSDTALNREYIQKFGKFAIWFLKIDLQVIHPERIHARRPIVMLGNHQSGMDMGMIGFLCPTDSVIIAKRELLYIPFFGWFLQGAGNLMIDRKKSRKAREALFSVIDTMKEKKLNLAIMPEGTRNRGDKNTLLPFKKGAFSLAVEAQFPILPVVCSNLEGIALWEKADFHPGKVIVSVLEPVETAGLTLDDVPRLTQEIWHKMDAEVKRINLLAKA